MGSALPPSQSPWPSIPSPNCSSDRPGTPWTQGLLLWLVIVVWISTWMQMVLYMGIIFLLHLDTDGWPLLATSSFILLCLHISTGPPPPGPPAAAIWVFQLLCFGLLCFVRLWLLRRIRTIYSTLTLHTLGMAGNTIL